MIKLKAIIYCCIVVIHMFIFPTFLFAYIKVCIDTFTIWQESFQAYRLNKMLGFENNFAIALF